MTTQQPHESIGYKQIYKSIDLNHCIEHFSNGDTLHTIIHDHPDKHSPLAIIEDFIRDIIKYNDLAYDQEFLSKKHLMIENRELSRYFNYLDHCLDSYSEEYVYCPQVQLFYEACKSLEIQPGWHYFTKPLDLCINTSYINCADLFNKLIDRIRMIHSSSRYRKKQHNFNKHLLKRTARVLTWEQDLFKWRSRHLILFLTLSYKAEYRSNVTVEQIQDDLFRLLNNRRHNALLNGINAYCWKIEEGGKVGLHVHLVMAYKTTSNRDINIADQIGQHWESVITNGIGQFNNENSHRGSHWRQELGMSTGQINHNDEVQRNGLRKLLEYLAKADQYLKHKTTAKTRTFQLSQIPEKSQRGRPRGKNDINIVQA
ncbi:hypothetical protein [Hydrogenophaga sp.]|uniref:hypothetical protein n=1 Tax=Hydrogenophaga sp. TaxID=1904254 RepID=UPI0035ADE101